MTVSFDTLPAFPAAALTRIRQQPLRAHDGFERHLERGAAFHSAGLPDYALAEFGRALSLRPSDVRAASASAALLLELRRPQAARRLLLARADTLWANADGCCNLALAHSLGGDAMLARQAFERALALAPGHMHAIEGLVRQAGIQREWDAALTHAEAGTRAHPTQPVMWLLWIDTLLHARRPHDAMAVLDQQALQTHRMPHAGPAFGVRRALVLALQGQWDMARATLVGLPPGHGPEALAQMQATLLPSLGISHKAARGVDVMLWGAQYASTGILEGDWHCVVALSELLREAMRTGAPATSPLLWQIVRPVLDSLLLPDSLLAICLARADAADIAARPSREPLAPRLPRSDRRLRIGLLIPPLDAEATRWLAGQLAAHDRTLVELRAYAAAAPVNSGTLQAQASTLLAAQVDHLMPIDHLSDDELVARIRLDQPDLLLDFSAGHPRSRPAVAVRRLARVHVRMHAVAGHVADAPYDYLLTDRFTHPGIPPVPGGAWARLPGPTWLACAQNEPEAARHALPAPSAPVRFTAWVPAVHIDELSFRLWLQLLQNVPGSALELLSHPADEQARLRHEATRAGIDAGRLLFAAPDAAAPARRIHLDPLLRSSPLAVSTALQRGEVVMACAARRTASRPGAAILLDAGLAQWVSAAPAQLVEQATLLAADPAAWRAAHDALEHTRSQAQADPDSPTWWNARARAAELGWAFTHMVERARAGLPPASFDVPRGAVPQPINPQPPAP